jgi:large subunit ribosomal protein L13
MKTKMIKHVDAEHNWYVVDARDKVLGRAATQIALMLMGKDKPDYTPHIDNGAGVIVLNCGKVRVTGKKDVNKVYKRFSGYPGGQKETVYKEMIAKKPDYILRHAVKGMLPKNKIGSQMLKRLKLYKGNTHPHSAQKPVEKQI